MTKTEELRLICLELALDTPFVPNAIDKAREYYAFLKEKDSGNVVNARCKLTRVK